jgi:hypothetical protein
MKVLNELAQDKNEKIKPGEAMKQDHREHEERQQMLEEIRERDENLARELAQALKVIDKLPVPWKFMLALIFRKEVENQFPSTKSTKEK